MRSVAVVFPASIWAMIPILRVFFNSSAYSAINSSSSSTSDNGQRPYWPRPFDEHLLFYERPFRDFHRPLKFPPPNDLQLFFHHDHGKNPQASAGPKRP